MKKNIGIIALFLLSFALIAGKSQAWFSSAAESSQDLTMTSIELNLIQNELEELRVENIGKGPAYVRVRLVPQWSDRNLSISNVEVNAGSEDWEFTADGYYYFRYYLTEGQKTSDLIESIEISNMGPEYEGAYLMIKATAEGVLVSNESWKDVWGMEELPFEPNQSWTQ